MPERIVRIDRSQSNDEGTPGVLTSDGFGCATLELPWRNNEPQISCIPAGTYGCTFAWSPRYQQKMYRIHDVPGRGGNLFHWGNWAGDVSKVNPDTGLPYRADTKGCTLVGKAHRYLAKQIALIESKPTWLRMIQVFGEAPFLLVVNDPILEQSHAELSLA